MESLGAHFTGTAGTMGGDCERQSVVYECRFVDPEDGCALARFAERIWEMEQCTSAVSAMAGCGRLGAHFKCVINAPGL